MDKAMVKNINNITKPATRKGLFRSIRTKITVSFTLMFLLVLVLIKIVSITGIPFTPLTGRIGVEKEEAYRKLNLVADLKRERILGWKEEVSEYALLASTYELLYENVLGIHEIWNTYIQEGLEGETLWDIYRQEYNYTNLLDILRNIQQSRIGFRRVYLADFHTGAILASSHEEDVGTTFSVQSFFSFSIGPSRKYMTDVISGPRSGQPSLLLGNVIANEEDKAIATLVIEVNPLTSFDPMLLIQAGLGERSEAFLFNQYRQLITHIKYPLEDELKITPQSQNIDYRLIRLEFNANEAILETTDCNNKPVIAVYRYIPMAPQWGWGMIVKMDKRDIFLPLKKEIMNSFLVGMLGILVLVGLTILLVENLTRPIRSLSWKAINVAKGDLGARAKVTTMDEVGTLATIFNSMIQRIQNWHQELGKQVLSRTADLDKANKELQKEIAERKKADRELKKYSEKLEEMVELRTRELREAQEELVRKEKLAILGLLAGAVGHELRNPLGVINNAVFFLNSLEKETDETTREYLQIIASEVQNAEKIVSDLMDYAITKQAEKRETSIEQLVRRVLKEYPPPDNIRVVMDFAPNLPPLFITPSQICKVLFNLIINAYQSMSKGGTLTISSRIDNGHLSLHVNDTGCGISEENMNRIFDPLFTTKARGIGLGLSVSRALLERNQGTITAQSVEGKGSLFILTFATKEKLE